MDWSSVLEALQKGGTTILIALISALAIVAVSYINKLSQQVKAKIDATQSERESALINSAIDRVTYLAQNTVLCIEQELVGDIKQAISEGTMDRTALLALKDKAVDNVVSQLTPEIINALSTQTTDIEGYIADLVSAQVYEIRNSNEQKPSFHTIDVNKLKSELSDYLDESDDEFAIPELQNVEE